MALQEKMKDVTGSSKIYRQDRDQMEQQLKELQVAYRVAMGRLER